MIMMRASLHNGELEISNLFEEGGWIIKVSKDNLFRLYEVPQFGGEERYIDSYPNIMEAIKEGESWT